MLIPAMLQEIRSGNGDDDGPTTLRFCKGCVAATVTTRRPCDYGVERLLGCTKAVATLSLICSPRDTAEGYDKHKPSQICRKFATCRRKFATYRRKFATESTSTSATVSKFEPTWLRTTRWRGEGQGGDPQECGQESVGACACMLFSFVPFIGCAMCTSCGGATLPGCSSSSRLCQRPHS